MLYRFRKRKLKIFYPNLTLKKVTSVVSKILRNVVCEKIVIMLNCMSIRTPQVIFCINCREPGGGLAVLGGSKTVESQGENEKAKVLIFCQI